MTKLIFSAGAGVPSTLTRKSRRAMRLLSESGLADRLATNQGRQSGQPVRKVLVLSDGRKQTSEQQLAPLRRYRQLIARKLGLVFEFDHVDRISAITAGDLSVYAAVGLKMAFDTPADQAAQMAETFFGAARAAGARCLVFDGDDDQCVLWPEVIDACDAYIKKHRFFNLDDYKKAYSGKTNLTDYASRMFGNDFSSDIIPGTTPLNETQIAKIILGWNIALDDKIYDLSRDIAANALRRTRQIDISCRASVAPENWIYGMRNDAVEAIKALECKMNVHAPTNRVPQQEYYDEMLGSWMIVSPFGYGELCWRDFEAILCGSILVKPNMSHVTTYPDLFVPGETYLPVAWDCSDLESVCAPILADPAARDKIRDTARKTLLKALTPEAFLVRLETTFQAASVLPTVPTTASA